MIKKTSIINTQVTNFLDKLKPPFRKEIELLRNYILTANSELTENIKWNGPNYCYDREDRITMRVNPLTKQPQLIFHRGAKKQIQPKDKIISNTSKLLVWKENDRAIVTFNSMQDIENAKAGLIKIVTDWIIATK